MVDAITGWLGVVILTAAIAVCFVSDVAVGRCHDGPHPSAEASRIRRVLGASTAVLLCAAVAATFARLLLFL